MPIDDDLKVRPRLAPALPQGFEAPSTPNLNQADPTLDTRDNAKPRQAKDDTSPYARRDEANDFHGFPQANMRLVGVREAYSLVTVSGVTLDIDDFSYFIIRSVGGSDFNINLPTPTKQFDRVSGDPILEAWGITVDIEYTGTGKPIFGGVKLPDDQDPSWTSTAGHLDTVVLTWAERWLLRSASFGYAL